MTAIGLKTLFDACFGSFTNYFILFGCSAFAHAIDNEHDGAKPFAHSIWVYCADSNLGVCKQVELKSFGEFVGFKFKGCLGLFGTHSLWVVVGHLAKMFFVKF